FWRLAMVCSRRLRAPTAQAAEALHEISSSQQEQPFVAIMVAINCTGVIYLSVIHVLDMQLPPLPNQPIRCFSIIIEKRHPQHAARIMFQHSFIPLISFLRTHLIKLQHKITIAVFHPMRSHRRSRLSIHTSMRILETTSRGLYRKATT